MHQGEGRVKLRDANALQQKQRNQIHAVHAALTAKHSPLRLRVIKQHCQEAFNAAAAHTVWQNYQVWPLLPLCWSVQI